MSKQKAVFCWSGGKDSSFALYEVLRSGEWDIEYLLCTLNGIHRRISMHGVREELLDAQADSIGIPLIKVFTYEASNAEYEKKMEIAFQALRSEGIDYVIYGDIFLEDLRVYREQNLEKIGMQAVFPLWKKDTHELVTDFLEKGFKTITCCVSDACLGKEHVGEIIDNDFLAKLPAAVDPCGENGEFHTFCFDGPIFKIPVSFEKGDKVYKPLELSAQNNSMKGFWYCELL